METRRERIKKAAARRRVRDASPGTEFLQPHGEGTNRKFFYIAAGAFVVALVAFLCGVQMGKSLSEHREPEELGARVQDRKGHPPPFRLMEKGRETRPGQEAQVRSSDSGERVSGETPPSPDPKGLDGKASDPEKSPAPEDEKGALRKARYTLQVAAFNNSTEADDLVNQLKKKGYDAFQVTGSAAAKGTLHRVRIGHFESLQEARQFALIFEKKENIKPIISGIQNP